MATVGTLEACVPKAADGYAAYCPASLTAVTLWHLMFTAKQILVILLALLLGVGTACAQVCDVSCFFQDKHQAPTIKPFTTASGHCHGQAAAPLSQEESHGDQRPASDCPPHEFTGAWLKVGAVAAAGTLQHFHHSLADLYLPLNATLARAADEHARAKSYRAPPVPAAIFVLRI